METTENLQKPTIFLVDDSKAFLSGLKVILEAAGHSVETFLSGKDLIARLGEFLPDILITDLEMPEMHGLELIRKVRGELGLTITPILALTGRNDEEAMIAAVANGADAFCHKESIKSTILAHISALLRIKASHEYAAQGQQLKAVKALIGTYKHEFGNALAILDGMFKKLQRTCPEAASNPAVPSINQSLERMERVLGKLNSLRNYEEQSYVEGIKILKIG